MCPQVQDIQLYLSGLRHAFCENLRFQACSLHRFNEHKNLHFNNE